MKKFINKHQLLEMSIDLSPAYALQLEKRGEFPKRYYLSRVKYVWDLAEIEDWLEARTRGEKWVSKR
jgi:prophage regulatory protein